MGHFTLPCWSTEGSGGKSDPQMALMIGMSGQLKLQKRGRFLLHNILFMKNVASQGIDRDIAQIIDGFQWFPILHKYPICRISMESMNSPWRTRFFDAFFFISPLLPRTVRPPGTPTLFAGGIAAGVDHGTGKNTSKIRSSRSKHEYIMGYITGYIMGYIIGYIILMFGFVYLQADVLVYYIYLTLWGIWKKMMKHWIRLFLQPIYFRQTNFYSTLCIRWNWSLNLLKSGAWCFFAIQNGVTLHRVLLVEFDGRGVVIHAKSTKKTRTQSALVWMVGLLKPQMSFDPPTIWDHRSKVIRWNKVKQSCISAYWKCYIENGSYGNLMIDQWLRESLFSEKPRCLSLCHAWQEGISCWSWHKKGSATSSNTFQLQKLQKFIKTHLPTKQSNIIQHLPFVFWQSWPFWNASPMLISIMGFSCSSTRAILWKTLQPGSLPFATLVHSWKISRIFQESSHLDRLLTDFTGDFPCFPSMFWGCSSKRPARPEQCDSKVLPSLLLHTCENVARRYEDWDGTRGTRWVGTYGFFP